MRYIVIRDPDTPSVDGRWYDYDHHTTRLTEEPRKPLSSVTYGPTGEWETRDDGVCAEVYRRIAGDETKKEDTL